MSIFKIKKNTEWNEYEVMVFNEVTGKKIPERSYFTDDPTDAIETFNAMVKMENDQTAMLMNKSTAIAQREQLVKEAKEIFSRIKKIVEKSN